MDAAEKATGPTDEDAEDFAAAIVDNPIDHRSHPRYAVDADSTLLLVSHGLSLQSHILDLSLEGCRLRILEHYAVGTGMRVEVAFKVNGIAFRLVGISRWTDGRDLVGVQFVSVVDRRREQLAEVVVEIERAAAARAAREAAERAALESATEEDTKRRAEEEARERERRLSEELAARDLLDLAERQAREWAEIQEIARRAKAARERAAQLERDAAEQLDRRAQARHAVDTTAAVLLIRCGSIIRGHILDLSLGGCHIRSDEKFPVGIYTRVEAEFHLEGLPFLLGGVIQGIHDPHNVGIRFLDVSERKRDQLQQLIEEIEEMRKQSPAAQDGSVESQD
jgi:c-di-GMP-binding flagellar brake protein YcgR